NVLPVRRVFLADLGVLVLVESDHDEVFAFLDDFRVVKNAAVVSAVRTPLRVKDETNRFLLFLRGRKAVVVRLPPDLRVVPIAARPRLTAGQRERDDRGREYRCGQWHSSVSHVEPS